MSKLKQFFCNHTWERQKVQFTSIFITYIEDIPVQELRIYTVRYLCGKCGKSDIKETYVEKGLTEQERSILVEETQRYEKRLDL